MRAEIFVERFVVFLPLPSPENLADALRCEQVRSTHTIGMFLVALHVEGFDSRGESRHPNRPFEVARQHGFGLRVEVVSQLRASARGLNARNGFLIRDPLKGATAGLQRTEVPLEGL